MKKHIKMRVVDWTIDYDKNNFLNNYFMKLLSSKYDIEYCDDPDFILYGPFGSKHLEYDCIRIFYAGENVRADFNIADYAIDFDFLDFGDRHLRLPYFYCHGFFTATVHGSLLESYKALFNANKPLRIADPNKFCAIMVSNNGWNLMDMLREKFYYVLSQYKKVDSGGAWNNNIGSYISKKIEWLKDYKFNICFENSSYPGYLTEKLFDAFVAGCIPIYWGDTSLRCNVESAHFLDNARSSNSLDFANAFYIDKEYSQSSKAIESTIHNHPLNPATTNNIGDIKINTTLPLISKHLLEYRINPKAFINAHNFPTLQDLAEEVKRIDNDKNAYLAMLQEPIFLDDFHPFNYYEERLFSFLDNIVSKGREQCYRRGEGQFLKKYEKILNNAYRISKLSHIPRNFIRIMKSKIKR